MAKPTPRPILTPAQVAELLGKHFHYQPRTLIAWPDEDGNLGRSSWCGECKGDWPCAAVQLARSHAAQAAQLAALRELLAAIVYDLPPGPQTAKVGWMTVDAIRAALQAATPPPEGA